MKTHSFPPIGALFFTALAGLVSLSSGLAATTLLSGSNQWYFMDSATSTGGGAMTDNTTTGTVSWTPDSSSGNTMIWAYLGSAQTLSVGDSLTFTFSLTTGSVNPSVSSFRLGLFNSGGAEYTPGTIDQYSVSGPGNAAFDDYAGYGTIANLGSSGTSTTYKRPNTAANATLWASSSLTSVGSNGGAAALLANTTYNASYSITRLSTGIQITEDLGSMSLTVLDSSSSVTSFDTVSFFSTGGTSSYTLTNLDVSYVAAAVPEPPVTGLLLGTLLGFALFRSLRRPKVWTSV